MANLATYCGKEFVVLQNECAKIVQTEFDFDSKTESLECSTANSNLPKKKSEFLPLLVKIIKVKAGSKMGIFSRQSTGVYNTMSQSKKMSLVSMKGSYTKNLSLNAFGKTFGQ